MSEKLRRIRQECLALGRKGKGLCASKVLEANTQHLINNISGSALGY
jgi:hypothetical protein